MMRRVLRSMLIAERQKVHLGIFAPLDRHYSSDSEKEINEGSWSRYANVYDRAGAVAVAARSPSDGEESVSVGAVKRTAKGKVKTQWVCGSCGHTEGKWWGTCPECEASATMYEAAKLTDNAIGSWLPQPPQDLRPLKLEHVYRGFNYDKWRIPLSGSFGNEISTVLGGGLVPGSLTLVGGDPGIGKSTLLLQIAAMLAKEGRSDEGPPVVYVSGEESLQQIGIRADRLGINSNIYLYSSTDIEDILMKTHDLSPRALVVDSIQTVYLKTIIGNAGGIMQVKECTTALMRFAKTTNIAVFLIGHVTKSGEIAGPRVLEHIVDVVLYMEVGTLLHPSFSG